jgi:hypothetical protein
VDDNDKNDQNPEPERKGGGSQKPEIPDEAIGAIRERYRKAESALAAKEAELADLKAKLEQKATPVKAEPAKEAGDLNKVFERLAAIESEAARTRMRQQLGANDEQIKAILDVQSKFPGMDADKALILARAEKPDLFKPPGFKPNRHGMLPPSGTSPTRSQPLSDKPYSERIEAAKDQDEREAMSQAEVLDVIARGRAKQTR